MINLIQDIFFFFNQAWVGSLIGIFGIIIGIIGIYSYKISKSTAKPSYQTYSYVILSKADGVLPDDIIIKFRNKIIGNLARTIIVIWNNGTEMLDGSNIISTDKLRIVYKENTNILKCKVKNITKPANKFKVEFDDTRTNQVLFSFEYFDPNDGVVLEIIHDSLELNPEIKGSIKGFPKGFENLGGIYPNKINNNAIKLKFLGILLSRPRMLIAIEICIGIGLIFYAILPLEIKKYFLTKTYGIEALFNDSMFLIILGFVYASIPASILWLKRKKFPSKLSIEEDKYL